MISWGLVFVFLISPFLSICMDLLSSCQLKPPPGLFYPFSICVDLPPFSQLTPLPRRFSLSHFRSPVSCYAFLMPLPTCSLYTSLISMVTSCYITHIWKFGARKNCCRLLREHPWLCIVPSSSGNLLTGCRRSCKARKVEALHWFTCICTYVQRSPVEPQNRGDCLWQYEWDYYFRPGKASKRWS
jgi:hypothetical protein